MAANLRKYSLYALAAVLIGALIYLLIGFINSRPPQEFTIATGREGGAYYQFATQYRDIVAEEGYTLNIRPYSVAFLFFSLLGLF